MHREHQRPVPIGGRAERLGGGGERIGVVDVAGPVHRRDQVVAAVEAELLEDLGAALGDRAKLERDVRHHVADEAGAGADALGSRLAIAVAVGQRSRSASRSTTIRFISSGIDMSKERMPASTWASGIAIFAATRAAASVVLVSP